MKHNRLLTILIFLPTAIASLFCIGIFTINTFLIVYPVKLILGVKTSLANECQNCLGYAKALFDI
jgi:hypothetical protein